MTEISQPRTAWTSWFRRPLAGGAREGVLIVVSAIALYLGLALATYHPRDPGWSRSGHVEHILNQGGVAGAWLADVLLHLFGYMAYLFPVTIACAGWLIFRGLDHREEAPDLIHWMTRGAGCIVTLGAGCGLATLHHHGSTGLPLDAGGIIGHLLGQNLAHTFNPIGATVFLLALFLTGFTLFTGMSWLAMMDLTGRITLAGVCRSMVAVRRGRELVESCRARWKREVPVEARGSRPKRRTAFRIEPSTPRIEPNLPAMQELGETRLEAAPPEAAREPRETRIEPNLSEAQEPRETRLETAPPAAAREPRETRLEAAPPAAARELGETRLEAAPPAAARESRETRLEAAPPAVAREPRETRLEAAPPTAAQEPRETRLEAAPPTAAQEPRETRLEAAPPEAARELGETWLEAAPPEAARELGETRLDASPKESTEPGESPEEDPLPSLSLLDEPKDSGNAVPQATLEALSSEVELKLADFGVEAQVTAVLPGPVVTRFELQLAPGLKVSKVTGLSKDLARSLSTTSVRIVDVIPGKSVIGLEIPNARRDLVSLSEVLKSSEYEESNATLPLALGKDISGEPVVVDLARMPHLLVAGTTGSGKSVAINAMVLSLLYKAEAADVRMIMIDPKMLELSVYEGIPHLLAPVVTDMKQAGNALRWCVAEMERRYRLMSALGVRNIGGFNHRIKEARAEGEPLRDPLWQAGEEGDVAAELELLPMIVVIVDELADLMMVTGKKVEELIARLAQKARASGIHLILATQRPSVDVITGLIKANIPSRISFQVSSKVDSRTIIDQMGAESLLGHGDMLYMGAGMSALDRVHGAFVGDQEVHRVVRALKKKGAPRYIDEILEGGNGEGAEPAAGTAPGGGDDPESDPLYDQAVRIVTETRRASISGVQRRLKIGYNRAARMLEQMEQTGVVGALQANGSREVHAPPPPEP